MHRARGMALQKVGQYIRALRKVATRPLSWPVVCGNGYYNHQAHACTAQQLIALQVRTKYTIKIQIISPSVPSARSDVD